MRPDDALRSCPMESLRAPLPKDDVNGIQRGSSHSRTNTLVALGLGLLAAAASFALFGASGRDDPYITFSAAEAIMESGRLVNINGDPIEQSTTLLLTLLLAGLGSLTGVSVPLLGWIVGFTALAAIAPVAHAILRQTLTSTRALVAATVVTITPPLMYWSASGAEQSLAILLTLILALLLTQIPTHDRRPWLAPAAGLVSALLFLARPDLGLSAIAATALMTVLATIQSQRTQLAYLGAITGLQIILVGVISLIRYVITGTPLPQPLSAKVGTSVIEQTLRGLDYFIANALDPWFIAFLVVAGIVVWKTRLRHLSTASTFLLVNAAALTSGTILSGGDWMELGRFFAAPATFLIIALLSFAGQLSHRLFIVLASVLLLSSTVTLLIWSAAPASVESRGSNPFSRWELSTTGSPGLPPTLSTPFNRWNADHLGDSYFLGAAVPKVATVLDSDATKEFTIASGQGGLIPYFLRQQFGDRIRFIDRFQLMTDDFADCDLQAGAYGSFISWNQWEEFAGDCAPPLPDMLFSIGPIPFDDLGNDYEVVVHVEGSAVQGSGTLPQEQWLAVKREYVDGRSPGLG